MVHFISPYRTDKDLGRAYNEAIALIPDEDAACLMDYDTMFLLPEQPARLIEHHEQYPDAVITCLTNRISPRSPQHLPKAGDAISDHIAIARERLNGDSVLWPVKEAISGFLMLIPKSVWRRVPFREGVGCLGVDTKFSRDLISAGVQILIAQDIYIWHTYRLETGSKAHLL